MAAEWWELAIPATGVLAGASLTLFGQARTAKRQRESERVLRLFDQKREAYAAFIRAADDLRDLVNLANQVGIRAEKERALSAELDPLMDAALEPGAKQSDERATRIGQLMEELNNARSRRKDAHQKATAAVAKLSEPGGLLDVRAMVNLIAPKPIRDAAERVEKLARDPGTVDSFLVALVEFQEAARRDLGVESK